MANNNLVFFEHQPSAMMEQWMGDDSMKIAKHFSVIDDYLYYDGENTGVYLRGSTGAEGKSAYEVAQENGLTNAETMEEWYDSLKGETGPIGPPMTLSNVIITTIPPKGNNNDYDYITYSTMDEQGNLYDAEGNLIPGVKYTTGMTELEDPTDPTKGYRLYLKVRQGNPGVVGPYWGMTQEEMEDAEAEREESEEEGGPYPPVEDDSSTDEEDWQEAPSTDIPSSEGN